MQVRKSMSNCLVDLLPIMDELNALQSSERTQHRIVEQLVKDLDSKTCAILEINQETELLEIKNFHNLSWEYCKNFHKPIDGNVLTELIWKGTPIYIPNRNAAASFEDQVKLEHEFNSAYLVQLIANQKPLGLLYIDSDKEDHFQSEQKLMAQLYAKIISTNLFLNGVNQKLDHLEKEDSESTAVRYEHYYPRLKEMFYRSQRLNETFSIIILDIRKFTSVVKTYGMDTVNELLKELVTLLGKNLRQYDGLCRFGSDEFLVTLPGVQVSDAEKVANKILGSVAKTKFTHQDLDIGLSLGIANYPANSQNLDGLITAVRSALYESKRVETSSKIVVSAETFE